MDRERSQGFISSLEGVRGYAFITVLLVHFQTQNLRPSHLWQWPRFVFISLGWLAVPIFFVLSGYLITQILLKTKGSKGFFRVFYARRALRVFPIYYAALAAVALLGWVRHWPFQWAQLSYLVYLQNLFPRFDFWIVGPHMSLGHLWSMALEEQFYLVWPVILWLCPDRRAAARACWAILAFCFLARVVWPLTHAPISMAYYFPLTRADEIACGALVAICNGELKITDRTAKWSAMAVVAGASLLVWRALAAGTSIPLDYFDVVLMSPVANIICTGILILLLCEKSMVSRACSKPWICHFGRLSYGMYIVHGLIFLYFNSLAFRLAPALGRIPSRLLSGVCAFLSVWAVAYVVHQVIEKPAMRAKSWFQYGPSQPVPNFAQGLPVQNGHIPDIPPGLAEVQNGGALRRPAADTFSEEWGQQARA